MSQKYAKHRVVQRVYDVVVLAHLAAECSVGTDERIERVAEHFPSPPRHHLDLGNADVDLGLLRQAQRRLRDVDGVVAYTLQVIRYFDRADDETKVARHRLLKREQLHRRLLYFHLQSIELRVALDDEGCLFLVAAEQRFDGKVSAFFGLRRHSEQGFLQRRKLIVKMPEAGDVRVSCHPNLPVIYASVRSSRGLVNICSVGPNSTSSPVKKKPVNSDARAACCRLCVTMMMVNSRLSS